MSEYTGLYRGAVQDVNDPENRGRIRALVPAALGEAVSGWAEPVLPTAETPVWSVGDKVWVLFEGGDLNRPVYISRMEILAGDIAPGAVTPGAIGGVGVPPAGTTTPIVKPLGYSGVVVQWDPIVNAHEFTKYRVLLDSVSPPAQVLTETAGTLAATSALPDGTPLTQGTTYYAQVIAFDVDGDGPPGGIGVGGPVAVPATAVAADVMVVNDLFSRQGYFGTVSAENIVGNNLLAALAVLGGLSVGPSISITPDNGIVVLTPNGQTHLPADGGTNIFSGDMVASALTVLDQLAIRGVNNEIAKNSTVTARTGSTAPMSGPSVTATYPRTDVHEGFNPRGLTYFATTDKYYSTESFFDGGLVEYAKDSNDNFLFNFSSWFLGNQGGRTEVVSATGGVAFIGTTAYLLCKTNEAVPGTFNSRWYVYRLAYNPGWTTAANKWSYVGRWLYEPSEGLGGFSTKTPAIGVRGSNVIIAQANTAGVVRVSEFTTGGSLVSNNAFLNTDGSNITVNKDCTGVVRSAADVGANKYWLCFDGVKQTYAFNDTTRLRETAQEFPLAHSTVYGMMWDTGASKFRSRMGLYVYTYSTIKDSDLTTNPIKVAATWRKANAVAPSYAQYETTISPPTTVSTFPKRAWLTATVTAEIPNTGLVGDPDALSVYIARGTSPALSSYRLAGDTTPTPVEDQKITTYFLPDITRPSPPTATDRPFPDTLPGQVRCDAEDGVGAYWKFLGDGGFRVGPISKANTAAPVKGLPQANVVATGVMTTGVDKRVAVSFGTTFDAAPAVTITPEAGSTGGDFQAILETGSVTTTGFAFNARRDSGTASFNVHWIAVPRT
jgi:hypothetical protein